MTITSGVGLRKVKTRKGSGAKPTPSLPPALKKRLRSTEATVASTQDLSSMSSSSRDTSAFTMESPVSTSTSNIVSESGESQDFKSVVTPPALRSETSPLEPLSPEYGRATPFAPMSPLPESGSLWSESSANIQSTSLTTPLAPASVLRERLKSIQQARREREHLEKVFKRRQDPGQSPVILTEQPAIFLHHLRLHGQPGASESRVDSPTHIGNPLRSALSNDSLQRAGRDALSSDFAVSGANILMTPHSIPPHLTMGRESLQREGTNMIDGCAPPESTRKKKGKKKGKSKLSPQPGGDIAENSFSTDIGTKPTLGTQHETTPFYSLSTGHEADFRCVHSERFDENYASAAIILPSSHQAAIALTIEESGQPGEDGELASLLRPSNELPDGPVAAVTAVASEFETSATSRNSSKMEVRVELDASKSSSYPDCDHDEQSEHRRSPAPMIASEGDDCSEISLNVPQQTPKSSECTMAHAKIAPSESNSSQPSALPAPPTTSRGAHHSARQHLCSHTTSSEAARERQTTHVPGSGGRMENRQLGKKAASRKRVKAAARGRAELARQELHHQRIVEAVAAAERGEQIKVLAANSAMELATTHDAQKAIGETPDPIRLETVTELSQCHRPEFRSTGDSRRERPRAVKGRNPSPSLSRRSSESRIRRLSRSETEASFHTAVYDQSCPSTPEPSVDSSDRPHELSQGNQPALQSPTQTETPSSLRHAQNPNFPPDQYLQLCTDTPCRSKRGAQQSVNVSRIECETRIAPASEPKKPTPLPNGSVLPLQSPDSQRQGDDPLLVDTKREAEEAASYAREFQLQPSTGLSPHDMRAGAQNLLSSTEAGRILRVGGSDCLSSQSADVSQLSETVLNGSGREAAKRHEPCLPMPETKSVLNSSDNLRSGGLAERSGAGSIPHQVRDGGDWSDQDTESEIQTKMQRTRNWSQSIEALESDWDEPTPFWLDASRSAPWDSPKANSTVASRQNSSWIKYQRGRAGRHKHNLQLPPPSLQTPSQNSHEQRTHRHPTHTRERQGNKRLPFTLPDIFPSTRGWNMWSKNNKQQPSDFVETCRPQMDSPAIKARLIAQIIQLPGFEQVHQRRSRAREERLASLQWCDLEGFVETKRWVSLGPASESLDKPRMQLERCWRTHSMLPPGRRVRSGRYACDFGALLEDRSVRVTNGVSISQSSDAMRSQTTASRESLQESRIKTELTLQPRDATSVTTGSLKEPADAIKREQKESSGGGRETPKACPVVAASIPSGERERLSTPTINHERASAGLDDTSYGSVEICTALDRQSGCIVEPFASSLLPQDTHEEAPSAQKFPSLLSHRKDPKALWMNTLSSLDNREKDAIGNFLDFTLAEWSRDDTEWLPPSQDSAASAGRSTDGETVTVSSLDKLARPCVPSHVPTGASPGDQQHLRTSEVSSHNDRYQQRQLDSPSPPGRNARSHGRRHDPGFGLVTMLFHEQNRYPDLYPPQLDSKPEEVECVASNAKHSSRQALFKSPKDTHPRSSPMITSQSAFDARTPGRRNLNGGSLAPFRSAEPGLQLQQEHLNEEQMEALVAAVRAHLSMRLDRVEETCSHTEQARSERSHPYFTEISRLADGVHEVLQQSRGPGISSVRSDGGSPQSTFQRDMPTSPRSRQRELEELYQLQEERRRVADGQSQQGQTYSMPIAQIPTAPSSDRAGDTWSAPPSQETKGVPNRVLDHAPPNGSCDVSREVNHKPQSVTGIKSKQSRASNRGIQSKDTHWNLPRAEQFQASSQNWRSGRGRGGLNGSRARGGRSIVMSPQPRSDGSQQHRFNEEAHQRPNPGRLSSFSSNALDTITSVHKSTTGWHARELNNHDGIIQALKGSRPTFAQQKSPGNTRTTLQSALWEPDPTNAEPLPIRHPQRISTATTRKQRGDMTHADEGRRAKHETSIPRRRDLTSDGPSSTSRATTPSTQSDLAYPKSKSIQRRARWTDASLQFQQQQTTPGNSDPSWMGPVGPTLTSPPHATSPVSPATRLFDPYGGLSVPKHTAMPQKLLSRQSFGNGEAEENSVLSSSQHLSPNPTPDWERASAARGPPLRSTLGQVHHEFPSSMPGCRIASTYQRVQHQQAHTVGNAAMSHDVTDPQLDTGMAPILAGSFRPMLGPPFYDPALNYVGQAGPSQWMDGGYHHQQQAHFHGSEASSLLPTQQSLSYSGYASCAYSSCDAYAHTFDSSASGQASVAALPNATQ